MASLPYTTLSYTTSPRAKLPEGREGENLFPRKRELERKVAAVEGEVAKGQKEMAALQLMVATYRQNPSFGDATKFQGELEAAILRVQVFPVTIALHSKPPSSRCWSQTCTPSPRSWWRWTGSWPSSACPCPRPTPVTSPPPST